MRLHFSSGRTALVDACGAPLGVVYDATHHHWLRVDDAALLHVRVVERSEPGFMPLAGRRRFAFELAPPAPNNNVHAMTIRDFARSQFGTQTTAEKKKEETAAADSTSTGCD